MFRLISLVSCALALAGCAAHDLENQMIALPEAGDRPTEANRFPESRGGFGPSHADHVEESPLEWLTR